MTAIDTLYLDLTSYVQEIEDVFLSQYLSDPLADANSYKHFVRAYCLLCHAAIEEYFEEVAKYVVTHCVDAWNNKRVLNDTLLALVSFHPISLKDTDEKRPRRSFDFLRNLLDESKAKFSKAIYENNGADIVYIKRLLEPVAVDISDDPVLLASLDNLVRQRGEFAHTGVKRAKITTILSPDDAKNCVSDCLILCDKVKDNANNRLL